MHYTGSVVRPPHEAGSVLLEVTVGCTHNRCAFCHYYRDDVFKLAPMAQIEADLAEVRAVYPLAPRVFALGADAFVLSFERLKLLAQTIRRFLPQASIGMYARITSMRNKSVEQMRELHALGIDDLVIGVESGDDEVLERVNKGYSASDIVAQCRRLEDAGIAYRVLYIGALAGKGKGEQNALRSASVLNRIRPTHLMLSSLTLMPGTELHQDLREGRFEEASELERMQELLTLVRNLEGPIVVLGNHVSNAVPFVAELPRDKDQLVSMLEQVVAHLDEDAYRTRREQLRVL